VAPPNAAAREADRREAIGRSMSSGLAAAVRLSRVVAELEENLRMCARDDAAWVAAGASAIAQC
jgi:hypothetical protein